jgi:hypothetical protein
MKVTGFVNYGNTGIHLPGSYWGYVSMTPYIEGLEPELNWQANAPYKDKMNSKGRFVFRNIPSGTYWISGMKPYSMYKFGEFLEKYLPPELYRWKKPDQNDIDAMWDIYNSGDFSDRLVVNAICMDHPDDEMENWIKQWEAWLATNDFPTYVYNYVSEDAIVVVGTEDIYMDIRMCQKGDALMDNIIR